MSHSLISEEGELISQQQLELLRQLSSFQSKIQFYSLSQIPLISNLQESQNISNHKQGNKQNEDNNFKKKGSQRQRAQMVQRLKKKASSNLFLDKQKQINHENDWLNQPIFLLNKQLQSTGPVEYYQLKKKLLKYKEKSEQIYKIGEYMASYEQNFNELLKQKQKLIEMLREIKGQTSFLVDKQKKLIDLSIQLKQSLDYYTYHEKYQFNYPCEISCRQIFQDNLQSTLSSIMDGIQFFSQNQAYISAKKLLNQYSVSKSKILSFIKSFYIKLFNKQNNFVMKHIQSNSIFAQLNQLYPKSRLPLLNNYLLSFPQFKKYLKQILLASKDQNYKNQKKKSQINYLQMREHQISQFLLTQSNISLIKYLQNNNYQIYTEVMLNLWTFNRYNYHQNLVFAWSRQLGLQKGDYKSKNQANDLNSNKSQKNMKQKLQDIKNKIYFVIQIVISQYVYFYLCCNPSSLQSVQFFTSWIYKLIYKYLQILIKQIREFIVKFKFNPFDLCQKVQVIVEQELQKYFQNISKQQYESYIIGCLWLQLCKGQTAKKSNKKLISKFQQNQHFILLKMIIQNSLKTKILTELDPYCFQNLPKIQSAHNKVSIQQNINQMIYYIPKLQYCTNNAETYMISSLDAIIKSIKQINLSIQSRFQCYTWNLLSFGCLKRALKSKKFKIISKQMRLDFNDSMNIIDKVKRLERSQSLIKYAQDIFNVIKSGMPSLNELTLDFDKYIKQHYEQLQERFLKDILFIYAKNMIQFLQKVMEIKKKIVSQKQIKLSKQQYQLQNQEKQSEGILLQKNSIKQNEQMAKLCDFNSMRSLYNGYILNIQKYIIESCEVLKATKECKLTGKQKQIQNIKSLIKQVYQKLFDFLDNFYISLSQFNSDLTSQFDEISLIKQKQQKLWISHQSSQLKKLQRSE